MTALLTYDRSGPEPTLYDVMDVLVRMDGRLETVETDVAELKVDVAELKVDVAELKDDVTVLKTDMASLETNMRLMERTQARMLERLESASLAAGAGA